MIVVMYVECVSDYFLRFLEHEIVLLLLYIFNYMCRFLVKLLFSVFWFFYDVLGMF